PVGRRRDAGPGCWCPRTRSPSGPFRPCAPEYVVPGDVAFRRGHADRTGEAQEVRRARQYRVIVLDPEDDFVTLPDPERVAHRLGYRDLALRCDLRRDIHVSPYLRVEVRIVDAV